MARVFVSEGSGAAVYVFADDHCPPHVHARHRGEGWVARVRFFYTTSVVEPISIVPLRNVPQQRVVSRLLDDVQTRLAERRRIWWMMRRTTCLENQWAVLLVGGRLALLPERAGNARQIAAASYDPTSAQLRVAFRDGSTAEMGTPT